MNTKGIKAGDKVKFYRGTPPWNKHRSATVTITVTEVFRHGYSGVSRSGCYWTCDNYGIVSIN